MPPEIIYIIKMADTSNSILQKLDGLEARFEEVSTLITDPDVIADQQRFWTPVSVISHA